MCNLTQEPPPVYHIRPGTAKFVDECGFRENYAFFSKECADFRQDDVVVQAMTDLGMEIPPDTFGRTHETHEVACKAFLKYDREDKPIDLPQEVKDSTLQGLLHIFAPYENSCPIIPDEEVKVPKDTSPGVRYKDEDYSRKGHVLDDPNGYQSVLDWYKDPIFPTVWKGAPKSGELLKESKLTNKDLRMFLIPGLDLHWAAVKLLYKQHELFATLAKNLNFPFRVGYTLQRGGFMEIMQRLCKYRHIVEGDCFKWDASFLSELFFKFIIPLRVYLYKPTPGHSKEWFENYLIKMYTDVVHSIVVLPNGQVFIKHTGMPSGWFLTTDDNCVGHLVILLSLYLMHGLKVEDLQKDFHNLYADDHIFGTDHDCIAPFEVREAHYARFGVTLKRDDDKVSKSPEGHRFLGFTARKIVTGNSIRFVPVYNYEKAVQSLLKPGGKIDPYIRFVRANALRVLCFYSEHYPTFNAICQQLAIMDVRPEQPTFVDPDLQEAYEWFSKWPSDNQIANLWTGDESGGFGGDIKVLSQAMAPSKKHGGQHNKQQKKARSANTNQSKPKSGKHQKQAPRKAHKGKAGSMQRTKESLVPIQAMWNTRFPAVSPQQKLSGSQILTSDFTPTSASATSYVIGSQVINPLILGGAGGGRISNFARLYEKFRYKWLEVSFGPTVGATTSGLFFIAIDADPNDTLSGLTGSSLQNALESMGSRCVFFQPFTPTRVRVSGNTFFTEVLFVDSALNGDRWAQAGKVFWGCINPTGATTSIGLLSVSCCVHLTVPTNADSTAANSPMAVKVIVTPSDTNPWGTNTGFVQNNCGVVYSVSSSKSILTFSKPGVYFVGWYCKTSIVGSETFTFVGTCNAATTPASVNPVLSTATLEQSGWAWVNVYAAAPGALPQVTLSSGGTHVGNGGNQLVIALSPIPVVTPGPITAADEKIAEMEKQLKALTMCLPKKKHSELLDEALYPEKYRPLGGAIGKSLADLSRNMAAQRDYVEQQKPAAPMINTFTATTSETLSGTVTPFGGAPVDVNLTLAGTSDVVQDLPVEVIPPAEAPSVQTYSSPPSDPISFGQAGSQTQSRRHLLALMQQMKELRDDPELREFFE